MTEEPKVTIGFFDYSPGDACPTCKFTDDQKHGSSMSIVGSGNLLEDRVARIERHLGLSIEGSDR